MKKAVLYSHPVHFENKIFDKNDPVLNRNDVLHFFHELKEQFSKKGYDLSTQDLTPIKQAEIVVFNDMPLSIPVKKEGQEFWLLAFESIAVKPENFDVELHKNFDKVFTWKDDIIDGKKYFKINYSFNLKQKSLLSFNEKKGFLCLINNHKYYLYENQLYTKRVDVIKWFEKHFSDDFDLYGAGWEDRFLNPVLLKILRKLGLNSMFSRSKPLKVFKGNAIDKYSVISNYKFNICFENSYGVPGYITEKIFDCFLTGTVPVYWGAPNIDEHIPKNCYVDYTQFSSLKELYLFLKKITQQEYDYYQKNISEFLNSEKAKKFSGDYCAETVAKHLE